MFEKSPIEPTPGQADVPLALSNLYVPNQPHTSDDRYPDDVRTFNLVPLKHFDAYLKDRQEMMDRVALHVQPETAVPDEAVPEPAALAIEPETALTGIPDSALALFSKFVEFVEVSAQLNGLSANSKVLEQPVKTAPKIIKTSDMQRKFAELPRNKKIGAIAAGILVVGLGTTNIHGNSVIPSPMQMFNAGGNGDKQTGPVAVAFTEPIGLGAMEIVSDATVRIPIPGFAKPLMFQRGNTQVEPATSIADTVDLVMAPVAGKDGKQLPFVSKSENGNLVVNRKNVSVVSTFKNYNALDVDCATQTVGPRYCVAASPAALPVGGSVTQNIADKFNALMLPNGANFSSYYHGTKAKLVVASLAAVSLNDCGDKIEKLGDDILTAMLNIQYPKDKVTFSDGIYPLLSPDYNKTFTKYYAFKDFTIERGDPPNSIADSLKVTCTVAPPVAKGA